MSIKHWLINDETFERAKEIVVRRKLSKYFPSLSIENDDELFLNEILESIEFEIIDKWNTEDEKNEDFIQLCSEYFGIIESMRIPDEEMKRIFFVFKLITYGYLGEKWESARRYIIENERSLMVNIDEKENRWRERVLKKVYLAVFYIVRKLSWDDLTKSRNLVSQLREEQKLYEKGYIEEEEKDAIKKAKALDLASLYHFARGIEIVAQFQASGEPNEPIDDLEFHFESAIKYTEISNNIEFNLLLRILLETLKKMIKNSIWQVARAVNDKVTKFIEIVTKSARPIIELLYPQKNAILENGLLDPAQRAIVVNLPTSSGKTIIAEFRILQALNQFSEERGWIVYVAPTRALVNQIAVRLRKDLGKKPLGIKIEKMSGALDLDVYETEIIEDKKEFDILVTTPEKLNLIIRKNKINRPLALAVIDEAHNLESEDRGLNLEILLSIIKKDCPKANFLLLTPFIPNSDEIARWLAPQQSKSIGIELNWQPNDRSLGIFYAEGEKNHIKTFYKTLATSKPTTLCLEDEILIKDKQFENICFSTVNKTKRNLIALVASQLANHDSILVMAKTRDDTYKIANKIVESLPASNNKIEEIELIRKFVISELGENFPLASYLLKGVGIHHSGLPDEVRFLMEFLMERGLIKYLVATTTIAQGINFPVSAILMASNAYPFKKAMPINDFWNLAGRAGRIDQQSVGILGIAVKEGKESGDSKRVAQFFREAAQDLVSTLEKMVNRALEVSDELNFEVLYREPEWSTFLQYIAHMYRQSDNLKNFLGEIEMTLRRTWGYGRLSPKNKEILLNSARKYAQKIDERKELASLSDMTGFSPETIRKTIGQLRGIDIKRTDWQQDYIFSSNPQTLKKLIGIMLNVPEISKRIKEIKIKGSDLSKAMLAGFISDWVTGKSIRDLTLKYFKDVNESTISYCVKSIYSVLTNSAVWGLSAIQKIPGSGLNFDEMEEEEKRNLTNLPAMIYYGVNTQEALLLRRANVPRIASLGLGSEFKKEFGNEIFNKSYDDAIDWLNHLDERRWDTAVPVGRRISGRDYKRVWQILSGIE